MRRRRFAIRSIWRSTRSASVIIATGWRSMRDGPEYSYRVWGSVLSCDGATELSRSDLSGAQDYESFMQTLGETCGMTVLADYLWDLIL